MEDGGIDAGVIIQKAKASNINQTIIDALTLRDAVEELEVTISREARIEQIINEVSQNLYRNRRVSITDEMLELGIANKVFNKILNHASEKRLEGLLLDEDNVKTFGSL